MNVARPDQVVDEFLPTRNSLLSRLRDWDDHESWLEFFDTYWRFLYSIALRCGLSNEDARDVVQETVVAAAKALRQKRFVPTEGASFKAWLRLLVRRRVADHLRRAKARPRTLATKPEDSTRTPFVEQIPGPGGEVLDEVWEEEWARNVAVVALERVKRQVAAKQFQMFDLYAAKGWSASDVARALHVSIAQVCLAKHRVITMLKRESARLRKRMETDGELFR